MASTPRKKNSTWIWYFSLLAILSLAASATLVIFNIKQQLTKEKFEQAKRFWQQHGPEDYDMVFTKKFGEATKEEFVVRVRKKKVVEATRDGQPMEERLYPSMTSLFAWMEGFLDRDAQPNMPRSYARATFDSIDGHLMRYVRSVSETHEKVEIVVTKFEKVGP